MTSPYPGNSLWPPDWHASTLTGRYVGSDGSTLAGNTISITMPSYVVLPADLSTVVPRTVTVTLDVDGSFIQQVPATDNTGIIPKNWTYILTENWGGGRTMYFTAPSGVTQDVSSLAPVPQSSGTVTYVGPPGAPGATGPPGVNWRGAWSAVTAYNPTDAVYYANTGSSYICLAANTGQEPDISPAYWQIGAAGGTPGAPGTASLGPVTLSGTASNGATIVASSSSAASWAVGASPTGSIMLFATATPPAGWLNCDGSAVSRTTYSVLFGVIGTTYGAGDGVSSFNVPNFTSAFPLQATPGLAGGTLAHQHGVTGVSVASHTHGGGGLIAATHTHSIPNLTTGSHNHNLTDNNAWADIHVDNDGTVYMREPVLNNWGASWHVKFTPTTYGAGTWVIQHQPGLRGTTESAGSLTTGTSATGASSATVTGTSAASTPAVSGQVDTYSSLPPWVGCSYIIKT